VLMKLDKGWVGQEETIEHKMKSKVHDLQPTHQMPTQVNSTLGLSCLVPGATCSLEVSPWC
jgi:hypothetical protein